MKLFNVIFHCQYSSLNDIVCNVNVNLAIKAMKQSIWTHLNDMILTVIIGKLHKRKQLCPHCLIFWSICPQIVLDNLIQSFTLIIHLRVISNRELSLNHLNLADFSSKIQSNARISIHHNASWRIKIILYMLKKEFHKVCSYSIISDEYKQCILYNTTNYSQNAIIFLTVLCLHQQR